MSTEKNYWKETKETMFGISSASFRLVWDLKYWITGITILSNLKYLG